MVRGLPNIVDPNGKSEAYILGKQHRQPFQSRYSRRAKAPLELVHLDLCGPMKTHTLAGNSYFMTFIDDCSKKIWVYFLKNKLEAFKKFKCFKASAKKQSGHYIKALRTDRGGEYISK